MKILNKEIVAVNNIKEQNKYSLLWNLHTNTNETNISNNAYSTHIHGEHFQPESESYLDSIASHTICWFRLRALTLCMKKYKIYSIELWPHLSPTHDTIHSFSLHCASHPCRDHFCLLFSCTYRFSHVSERFYLFIQIASTTINFTFS